MPVAAAKHKPSRPFLRSRDSSSSLSSSSLSSSSSSQTLRGPFLPSGSQDRLASLAETSKRELLLNEEGLLALGALEPPRAAFMRRAPSSSSLTSTSSMSSMTSTSSLMVELGDPHEVDEGPVLGAELQISCTKSDGDADGSVESSSMKSGSTGSAEMGKSKKKGGLFKRLGKAIGLEMKGGPGADSERRGSL